MLETLGLMLSIGFVAFLGVCVIIVFACCVMAGECSRIEEHFEEQFRQEYEKWKEQKRKETEAEDNSSCME